MAGQADATAVQALRAFIAAVFAAAAEPAAAFLSAGTAVRTVGAVFRAAVLSLALRALIPVWMNPANTAPRAFPPPSGAHHICAKHSTKSSAHT